MKQENKLEKNKCKYCPLKNQRQDLTRKIIIENLNLYEYDRVMEEIKMTVEFLNKVYENEKCKIKVTGC